MLKPLQIAAVPLDQRGQSAPDSRLFVLADDGSLWKLDARRDWIRLPPLPDSSSSARPLVVRAVAVATIDA